MRRRLLSYPVLAVVLFVLYFATAEFGLRVHAVNSFATLVWIPSGLSLAFLFIFGLRFWPAVATGAFAANYFNDAPVLAAAGISLGNTLEPLIGAYLLKRVVKLQPTLERVKDVIGLIFFAAISSTLISASIGVTSLWLNDVIESADYASTWFAWWSGDAISILVLTPVLLVWSTRPAGLLARKRALELTALILLLILLTEVIFGSLDLSLASNRPRTYLVFPFLMWVALRFGQRASVSLVFLIAVAAIWHTVDGIGPFSSGTPEENLLNLQLYMAVVATTTMILAAVVSERTMYERKKDEFISVASHELKTPITSIKTFTQTLQVMFERKGDKQSSAHMSRMNRQIDRLNRLVVKLLDLTRIQEGRITLQKEKFNIGSLMREIVEEVSETTHHKIEIKGDTRLNIIADRDRIGRVLTNLLSNAADYSPKADKIVVRLKKKDGELSIAVRDFGIGIAKEDLGHVFNRFYRAENANSTKNPARTDKLGLGLYIAKEIVSLHGGKLWVKSNQGTRSGSTFYLTLPLKPPKK